MKHANRSDFGQLQDTDVEPEKQVRVLACELDAALEQQIATSGVPHIFTRKSRVQPKEILITNSKRLFQQHRSKALIAGPARPSADIRSSPKPDANARADPGVPLSRTEPEFFGAPKAYSPWRSLPCLGRLLLPTGRCPDAVQELRKLRKFHAGGYSRIFCISRNPVMASRTPGASDAAQASRA